MSLRKAQVRRVLLCCQQDPSPCVKQINRAVPLSCLHTCLGPYAAPPREQGLSRVKNVVDTTTCSQTERRTDMNTGGLPEGRADRRQGSEPAQSAQHSRCKQGDHVSGTWGGHKSRDATAVYEGHRGRAHRPASSSTLTPRQPHAVGHTGCPAGPLACAPPAVLPRAARLCCAAPVWLSRLWPAGPETC